MQWMTLFMVTVGIGLWGLLQFVAAGVILLVAALIIWFIDVVKNNMEESQ